MNHPILTLKDEKPDGRYVKSKLLIDEKAIPTT